MKAFYFAGALALGCLLSSQVLAQPGGGGFGGRGGFNRGGGGAGGGGVLGLLQTEEVRDEIELLDEQQQELTAIGEEMREQMRETFMSMRDAAPEDREMMMQDIRAQMQEMQTEMEERMQEVLMPHQYERLKQIELQQQMQRRGNDALTSDTLADALGLTEEQIEEMRQKAVEAQATLQEKIEEARKEARDEILSVLTPDQRAKFDEMVGEQFSMPERQRGRGGFQGQGGRGGRGGQGGQGGQGGRRGGGRPELE